jgi:methylthioxylose transferase
MTAEKPLRAEPFDELRTAPVEARIDAVRGTPPWVHRLADPLALALALALIGVSAYIGHGMNQRGLPIVLPRPPLLAFWHPHVGWGTPLSVLCVLVGLRLQREVEHLGWRRLLLAGWLLNLAWLCSLTLIDGLRNGWIDVLLNPNEYLHDVPRITDPGAFLSSFTHFIAFGDGVDGSNVWTTHVAGHPPLATLIFWLLARIGLPGGFWAGALCILVSSAASVAMPVALRELGAGAAARRIVPLSRSFRVRSGWRCQPTACSRVWQPAASHSSASVLPEAVSLPAWREVCCSVPRCSSRTASCSSAWSC